MDRSHVHVQDSSKAGCQSLTSCQPMAVKQHRARYHCKFPASPGNTLHVIVHLADAEGLPCAR